MHLTFHSVLILLFFPSTINILTKIDDLQAARRCEHVDRLFLAKVLKIWILGFKWLIFKEGEKRFLSHKYLEDPL